MKNFKIEIKIKDVEETREFILHESTTFIDATIELDYMLRTNTDGLLDMEIEKISIASY